MAHPTVYQIVQQNLDLNIPKCREPNWWNADLGDQNR